jgi:hypothetical protein
MNDEKNIPDYCTQNGGDCLTCSLVNYGRDCMNNPVKKEGETGTPKAGDAQERGKSWQ